MIYIPIIKTKPFERDSLEHLWSVFEKGLVIPYIEITKYFLEKRERPSTCALPIAVPKRPIYLEEYTSRLPMDREHFVGILHGQKIVMYSDQEYLLHLHVNVDAYKDELIRVLVDPLAIPVFEIRHNSEVPQAQDFTRICRQQGRRIALRLEAVTIETVQAAKSLLHEDEYLFVEKDIRQRGFTDLMGLRLQDMPCQLIIVDNSRKEEGALSEKQPTAVWLKDVPGKETFLLPDISEEITYWNGKHPSLPLAGFADFCSLKNDANISGGGQTRKYAIFYDSERRDYRVFSTPSANEQFRAIYPLVMNERPILDPSSDCLGYEQLRAFSKPCGTFGSWNAACLTRYIHQVFKKISK